LNARVASILEIFVVDDGAECVRANCVFDPRRPIEMGWWNKIQSDTSMMEANTKCATSLVIGVK
jgi:hypothetical protein